MRVFILSLSLDLWHNSTKFWDTVYLSSLCLYISNIIVQKLDILCIYPLLSQISNITAQKFEICVSLSYLCHYISNLTVQKLEILWRNRRLIFKVSGRKRKLTWWTAYVMRQWVLCGHLFIKVSGGKRRLT